MHLLLIEDDNAMAEAVIKAMTDRDHEVTRASTGFEATSLVAANKYEVMIVDRMLPDIDGLDWVIQRRADADRTPALMLTALGSVTDRVDGLKRGADDYLSKPFSMDELEARVLSLARRSASFPTVLCLGNLIVDRLQRSVTRGGEEISLMPREFQLLEILVLNSPSVVTRTMLLETVWNFKFDPGTNIVESHLSRLRSKLDRGEDPPLIHTVRGQGYVARSN